MAARDTAHHRPRAAARLSFNGVEGFRTIAFRKNTRSGQLSDLVLRYRRRAREQDWVRLINDTA